MIAIVWIDWYSYHHARFEALQAHASLRGRVVGIELVGGVGVHSGLKFRETRESDAPIITLAPNQGWKEAGQLRLATLLWKKLDEIAPSVVFVPGYYTLPGIAGALWGKLHGARTVLMTESTEQDHARSLPKELAKGLLIRTLFDWAIAGGAPHVRYLMNLYFPASRIARFYDVVDNRFFQKESRVARASDTPVSPSGFLYVGRLAPEKNIDGLLRSFAEYCRKGGAWPLVLAGDGPEKERLRQLAAQLGVETSVTFAGLQPNSALPAFYAAAQCFVLPSSREPWGLVANEAMACGLPVIVSAKCGCVEDLVANEVNGYVFDPSDAVSLTRALLQMSELSPARRARMGMESTAKIADYSPAQWADEVARIAGGETVGQNGFTGAGEFADRTPAVVAGRPGREKSTV